LNWSKWIRQIHRWLSIAFTLCVLANVVVNFVVSGQEKVALWVGLVTLVPLFLLLLTGLYLFVLPYSSKGRSGRRTAE
jgi:quinol-cytochrome oxidoreductase complex cytochrome b subunit